MKQTEAKSSHTVLGIENKLKREDAAAHDWYRFVLSFPPHLVRHYLKEFNAGESARILDPFCGTGTTLVECKKAGCHAIGIESNLMAHFASVVKTNWDVDPHQLRMECSRIYNDVTATLTKDGVRDHADLPLFTALTGSDGSLLSLDTEATKLLLKDSISPIPLHKTLRLIECVRKHASQGCLNHLLLAVAKSLVTETSNLRFGPEVGVGKIKLDAPVLEAWRRNVDAMARDLETLPRNGSSAEVFLSDSREPGDFTPPESIDAVITSPPYPNEKDYSRTTRLESVLLGFIRNQAELRALKKTLLRSNTRGVYKEDGDDLLVSNNDRIQKIAAAIEEKRIALGKTSGFERMYARVTRLYFGGMYRHLNELRSVLKPGAKLAYVVGDQASFLQVHIPTGQALEELALELGYKSHGRDLFRERWATATNTALREEVLVLEWPGPTAPGFDSKSSASHSRIEKTCK